MEVITSVFLFTFYPVHYAHDVQQIARYIRNDQLYLIA